MATATLSQEVRNDLIRTKAYEIYLERGATHGQDLTDWLRAEKLVDRELQGQASRSQARSEPTGFSPSAKITTIPGAPPKTSGSIPDVRSRRGVS